MAKLVINDITSGYASTTALNTAFTAIETALENTLSRDGTSPNPMSANLDMNGYAILNARATTGNENFIWLGTWTTGTSYAVNNLVYAPEGSNLGNTLICVTANTAGATLDGDASKWAVFAQRGAAGAGTGDVAGPASSTADSLARFNGTTGKLLKDGAVVGVDIMAYDAGLAATTAFAKTLLNDADAPTARTTLGILISGTATTASGTSVDFTGIPAGTKRVYICLDTVSTNGTSNLLIQIGDAGGVETTGYRSSAINNGSQTGSLTGFIVTAAFAATYAADGLYTLVLLDSTSNNWVCTGGVCTNASTGDSQSGSGAKSLTAALDRIRVTTVNGTDTFDSGTINIIYE